MNYRQFGNTDLKVSEIGFGAWGIAGPAMAGDIPIGSIVQSVVKAICNELNAVAEELGENKENIYFRLPPELR